MQTFLPYPSFIQSAQCLDYRRLGKQRVEARQILDTIYKRKLNPKTAWANHPAVLMWIGYENYLMYYSNVMIREWIRRGYVNNMKLIEVNPGPKPPWLGIPELHISHRSNLLRKYSEYYSQFGWKEPPDFPYFWPTKEGWRR